MVAMNRRYWLLSPTAVEIEDEAEVYLRCLPRCVPVVSRIVLFTASRFTWP